MEAATRIALLLLGFGMGDVLAEEPLVDEDRASPIFVVRPPAPAPLIPAAKTLVQQQLTSLLRSEIGPTPNRVSDAEADAFESGLADATRLLRLEKMTVRAPRLLSPQVRETAVEKFTRTGHLWEFSPTKRFMIGPKGDKVGLMFSFDW